MKQICRKCHFLAKTHRTETGEIHAFSLSSKERDNARSANINFVEDHYSLNCHQGVWNEGAGATKEDRLKKVNSVNRKNKCFFWPYDRGMLFQAAIELQKRAHENDQLKRSNFYTRIGLWIAAISLFFSAIVFLINQ